MNMFGAFLLVYSYFAAYSGLCIPGRWRLTELFLRNNDFGMLNWPSSAV
jgi:hypothetical protein